MKETALHLALILLFAAFALTGKAQVKVTDATNGNIVILAQIQDTKGRLIGFTTKEGMIPADIKAAEGLTIHHMAYETYTLTAADIEAQMAALTPRTYNVDEVVIKGGNQDYIYLRGYYRKYINHEMLDTLTQEYIEGMLEYVIKNKEVLFEKKPHVLSADIYTVKLTGDSIVKTSFKHNDKKTQRAALRFLPTLDAGLLINSYKVEKLDFSLNADTLQGKFWPKAYFSKSGKTINVGTDELADKEGHTMRFPLLTTLTGVDIMFTDMNENQLYHLREPGQYKFSSLMGLSSCQEALMGGKRIVKSINRKFDTNISKKDYPMKGYFYTEVFFTDMEYISKERAKELKKHEGFDESVVIEIPESAPELSPATVRLKEITIKNENDKKQ
ncbi:MAG: hypothetical protein IKZ61_00560 [Prevotella sp.]|nr:hypothetical protein [Prevotella sp.]